MMIQTLRELERAGLVSRDVTRVMPPAVDYRLTGLGRKFVEPLEVLYRWGAEYAALLDQIEQNLRSATTTFAIDKS